MSTSATSKTPAAAADVPVVLPAEEPSNGQSVVLYDISWQQYEGLVESMGDRRFRHTYDQGTLEIMTLSFSHGSESELLSYLLMRMTEELGIEIKAIGSTTQRKHKLGKGIEPDRCYYIANEQAMRHRGLRGDKLDLARDPPPDLAIEIDVTSSSVPRLPVFAAIGIGEVWRFTGKGMTFYELVDGDYQGIERSKAFPFLPAAKLQEVLAERATKSDLQLIKDFLAWVREATKQAD